MSDDTKKRVTFAQALPITGKRVGEFFESELFKEIYESLKEQESRQIVLANPWCTIFGAQETEGYAFLVGTQTRKGPWGLFRNLRPMVANLNMNRGNKNDGWLLEIYGSEYVDMFTKWAKAIAEKFAVDIHVRLETEIPKKEYVYSSDYDY